MNKERRYFISTNMGGIANRIKCLVSLLRLNKEHKRDLYLYWPLNYTCGAKFNDLFENKIDRINEKQIKSIKKNETDIINNQSLTIKKSSKKYIICGTWRLLLTRNELNSNPYLFKKRIYDERGLDFNFSNIPNLVKKDILSYLRVLKPIKEILVEIDKFQRRYNLKNFIGIHIRRGDFANRAASPGKVSTNEKFIERMNELIKVNPKLKFFLCTDSEEIENKIEKEFSGRIIKFPKTSFSRTDVRATQEGLIDLILLSKTKHIIGTYRSTFTELAWWFGECKPKIEIIIDYEKEREYIYNTEKERKKIIPKIKRLILKLIGRRFF